MNMTLVERAAKRLEELRKAIPEDGEIPAASAPGDEDSTGTLIERVAVKLQAAEGPLVDGKPDPHAERWANRGNAPDRGRAASERREPTISVLTEDDLEPGSPGTLQSRKKLKLDLGRFAAEGYITPQDPESALANEFRRIKRPLVRACHGRLATPVANANRIMVTSSVPGEGKSFVALNLALSLSMERDSTVLLIDADTTRQTLSQLLGSYSAPGLLDVVVGQHLIADVLLPTDVKRLSFLPAGPKRPHATEYLASETMANLVDHIASRYADRILIFDSPPLLKAPEASVLASYMGQVIVVVEAGRTTHKMLADAMTTIQSCPLVATVLNKSSTSDGSYYSDAPRMA